MRANLTSVLVVATIFSACAPGPVVEESAPKAETDVMFRGGPTHAGIYETEGVEAAPSVLWKFATGGRVLASPAVVAGKAFVGSDDGTVYAIDTRTGTEVWRFETGEPVRSSPAVADGRVFFGSYDGNFYALNADTGKLIWRFVTTGERRWRAVNLDGMRPAGELYSDPWDFFQSSPAIVDGVIYFGTGEGVLYALDAETGTARWTFETADTIHSSPAVADGTVYFGNMESRLYAVDADTGEPRWHYQAGTDSNSFNQHGLQSSPAVANGRVYIGGRDGGVHVVDAQTGEAVWKFDTSMSWVLGSPAVAGNSIYFGTSDTSKLYAVDATTGEPLFSTSSETCIFSSPAIVGETVYVGTCGGVLFAIDAVSGETRWSFRTEAHELDRPGVLNPDGTWDPAKVFAGEYTFENATAAVERILDLGAFLSSPVLHDGVLYVGSGDGHLYALAPKGDQP
jgi:outer membrane protein assembly factor BamB